MPEQSKTVDAALKVLDLLGAESDGDPTAGRPALAGELGPRGSDSSAAAFARRLHLSRTAVGRILATLEAHGLARRTGRGWRLGFGVLALAGRIEPVLRVAARPAIEDLAARFDETAVLALRDGGDAVAVDQVVAGHHVVQVRMRPGTRHPLDRGALGRALLPEEAAAGHVVRSGEPEPGVTGVAAPIFVGGHAEEAAPVASIGLVAPAHRFRSEDEVVAAVRAAARTVSAELGEGREGGDDDAVLPASG